MILLSFYNNGKISYKKTTDPLEEVKSLLKSFKPAKLPELPPFWGGLVGYVGYDIIHFYEPVPDIKPDTLKLPDIFFFLSDEVVSFDNVKKTIKIIVSAFIDEKRDIKQIYEETVNRIKSIEKNCLER
ncbi:MAG: hypothetical protein Q9M89_02140 [Persephonella sp.]|nr:hypothetical protein [Persephonella sp.]